MFGKLAKISEYGLPKKCFLKTFALDRLAEGLNTFLKSINYEISMDFAKQFCLIMPYSISESCVFEHNKVCILEFY